MATLGWLVEFLLASYSITGGLMDGEGLQPSNEMLSLNDALTLKSAVFVLLKKHFRGHPAYLNFLETFHEISFLIEMGEEAGRIASKEQKPREWSSDQYGFIVRHRSACDSYYLSVCLALHYLGLDTPKNIQQTRDVLLTGGNHRLLGSGVQGVSSPHAETGTSTSHLCDDSQHEALQDSYGKDNPKLAAILEYIRLCGLKEAPLHP
ncbi:hypothetical protein BDV59DRAFT_171989 [Aspergillus ambiguus]|uniref:uncharacterized protein n=1 Tax=Aspergillus ambiguus TaxID=176160 RepID=UPI003CCE42B8